MEGPEGVTSPVRPFEKFLTLPPCAANRDMIYYLSFSTDGEVAQLVEHHVRNVGVESSNLFFSTIPFEVMSPKGQNS